MAELTMIERARILMDLVKDGEVADRANYANVEMAAPPLALDIAQRFWNAYGSQLYDEQDPPQPRDPTNDEMATLYVNQLRKLHKTIRKGGRLQTAGTDARAAEAILADADNTTDFGEDE